MDHVKTNRIILLNKTNSFVFICLEWFSMRRQKPSDVMQRIKTDFLDSRVTMLITAYKKYVDISFLGMILDKNCVCVCLQSGSMEQSWAKRSIASSIIHQSHTDDIDWTGSGRGAGQALSLSVCLLSPCVFLSEVAISLWKQSSSEQGEQIQTYHISWGRALVYFDNKRNFQIQHRQKDSIRGTDMWVKVD